MTEFCLYESVLGARRRAYMIVERYPLGLSGGVAGARQRP